MNSVLACLLIVQPGLVHPSATEQEPPGVSSGAGAVRALLLRVVDRRDGRPVSNAMVRTTFPLALDLPRQVVSTGDAGDCVLRIPRLTSTHLLVVAEGHGWAETAWDSATLPEEHQIELEPGTKIGGMVLDQRGVPVPGARIRMIRGAGGMADFAEAHRGHSEITNDEGRWECAHAPANLESIRFHVFHPDHAVALFDAMPEGSSSSDGLAVSRLVVGSAVMLLRRGEIVTGRVVDDAGNPVEGARISGGSYPVWTPIDGRFRLAQAPAGPLEMMVEAAGYEPAFKRIEVSNRSDELVVRLASIAPLRLRVVDSTGRPLFGATVRLVSSSETGPLTWCAETDEQGWVEWSSPPRGSARFHAACQGYDPADLVIASSDGAEHTLRLRRPLRILGEVVDARTREPIASFRVFPGRFHDDHHHWEEERVLIGHAGRFRIDLRGAGLPHAVKVEADGYYPAISRAHAPDAEQQAEVFEMTPGTPISGVVLDSEGVLVPGAQVGLATHRHPITLGSTQFVDHDRSRIVLTDDRGRFVFQPQRDGVAIFVAHALGFAEVRLDTGQPGSLTLTLRPWSRIEGQLRIGAIWAADRLVALVRGAPDGLRYHENQYAALTDQQGRFAWREVPPGNHRLVRIVRGQASHATSVVTEPGRASNLEMGGEGRLVIGNVRLSPSLADEHWGGNHPGTLRRALDEFPFVLEFEADGAFRVEDVPPGDYLLEVHYHDPGTAAPDAHRCRGQLRTRLTIPAAAEPGVSEPVELGEFEVPLRSDAQIH